MSPLRGRVGGLEHQRIPAAATYRKVAVGVGGQTDKAVVQAGNALLGLLDRGFQAIIGAGEPSALNGTLSRGTTSATGAVEIEIWLSNMNASIRNQVLVTEITAMNQIDQMPLRR